MKFCKSATIMLLCLASHIVEAQTVTFGGEYRFNPVYSRGFREPMYEGDKPGLYTMQRTRFILNYAKDKDLDAEVIVQDRRFWGDQSDRGDVPNIAVFRAWVEKYVTPNLSVRLGRQGFVYDDQYLLGDPNWGGTRAHDAGLVKWEKNGLKVHLAFAYNANGQEAKRKVYEYDMYKTLQFLWIKKEFGSHFLTFTAINRGLEKGNMTSAYTQTFGPYANIVASDKLSLKGMYYHQIGETTGDLDVNAYFFSAQVIYKPARTVQFTLGVDAASGTDQSDISNPAVTETRSFDLLYGLPHGQFGHIDYFYVTEPTLHGVHDYYLKAKVNVTDKLSIENHIHEFTTSASIDDPLREGQTMSPHLGIENNLMVGYKFSPEFKATVGHAIMFGTPTLEQTFGGQQSVESQMFYAVITAALDFFKSTPRDNR